MGVLNSKQCTDNKITDFERTAIHLSFVGPKSSTKGGGQALTTSIPKKTQHTTENGQSSPRICNAGWVTL